MSICTKLQNKKHVLEALCRAKFKFPGCQKIHISKWDFTKFNADEFENMVPEKRLIPEGCGVKYIPNRGPWTNGGPCPHDSLGACIDTWVKLDTMDWNSGSPSNMELGMNSKGNCVNSYPTKSLSCVLSLSKATYVFPLDKNQVFASLEATRRGYYFYKWKDKK
eukprot:bmy_00693T0